MTKDEILSLMVEYSKFYHGVKVAVDRYKEGDLDMMDLASLIKHDALATRGSAMEKYARRYDE